MHKTKVLAAARALAGNIILTYIRKKLGNQCRCRGSSYMQRGFEGLKEIHTMTQGRVVNKRYAGWEVRISPAERSEEERRGAREYTLNSR